MLQEVLEPAWVDAFEAVLARCELRAGASPLLFHGGRYYTEHPL